MRTVKLKRMSVGYFVYRLHFKELQSFWKAHCLRLNNNYKCILFRLSLFFNLVY